MDTFTTLWNRLQLRAPGLGQFLASDLIRDAFQQLAERRQWSWLQRHSCLFPPTYNMTDKVAVTPGIPVFTSSGGQFIPAMINQQIRLGGNQSTYPTYTILQVISPTVVIVDQPWSGPALSNQPYTVFQCYFPMPSDFQSFYSLINPTINMRLWTNITQAQLDLADAQRVVAGPSYGAAFYDYTQNYQGFIAPVQPVSAQSLVSPVSTTSYGYSYPADSIFSILITVSGSPGDGNLAFEWKQDSASFSLPVVVQDNSAIDLSNGVQIYFPQSPYFAGDTFVIVCTTDAEPSLPRYELWPRPINTPYAYPFLYICKLPALTDQEPQLPPYIAQRGDVLLEMALAQAALFPGTATTKNPYYDLNAAKMHAIKAETLIYELEKKDDDTATKDLTYLNMDFAPTPWLDGSYLQSHAWPYASW